MDNIRLKSGKLKSMRIPALFLIFCLGSVWLNSTVCAEDSWSMLAHDRGRSGATPTEIRPPFERKWCRLFPDEGLLAGVHSERESIRRHHGRDTACDG